MRCRRPLRSSLAGLLVALGVAACATVPAREPVTAEAEAAQGALLRRWQAFEDLRTLADIQIRQGDRRQRLSGVLLLKSPASLRFEALSPFGPPFLLVGATPDRVTVWEVLKNRVYLLPSEPDSNRRWLGLALGAEDLVAILSGHARPMADPAVVTLLAPDEHGTSLSLKGAAGTQRIWLDPVTGEASQILWTETKNPFRVVFTGASGEPTAGVWLATLDGRLEVNVRYREPRLNSAFDPDLIRVTVPQGVDIQDFR